MSYLYLFEARGRTNYIPYNLLFRGLEFLPFVVGQHELPRGGMYKRNAYEKWDRQKKKVFSFYSSLARFGRVSNMVWRSRLPSASPPLYIHDQTRSFCEGTFTARHSPTTTRLLCSNAGRFTKHVVAAHIPKCLRRARRSASQAVWKQGRLLPGSN